MILNMGTGRMCFSAFPPAQQCAHEAVAPLLQLSAATAMDTANAASLPTGGSSSLAGVTTATIDSSSAAWSRGSFPTSTAATAPLMPANLRHPHATESFHDTVAAALGGSAALLTPTSLEHAIALYLFCLSSRRPQLLGSRGRPWALHRQNAPP